MNKDDIARRFGQSATTYDSASTAQQRAVEILVNNLNGHIKTGSNIFEVGCGTGHLTRDIMLQEKPHLYIANDISEGMLEQLATSSSANLLSTLLGDAETLEWPQEMDAILSASAVQWFDNPLSFIDKSAQSLAEGGVMGLVTYGPSTFKELQTLGVQGLHYPTIDEWRQRIQSNDMHMTTSITEEIVLRYPTPLDVMKDLHKAGVTSSDKHLAAGSMRTLMRKYDELYASPEGIPLTYEVYVIVAQK